jgi:hypothetical protein
MVSVPASTPPPASPNKPGQARGAPLHIHVSVPEAPRVASLAMPPPALPARAPSAPASRAATPAKAGSTSAPSSGAGTPVAGTPAAQRPPPSSSKRMLAPNGQPRKIPMAMDFDEGERGGAGLASWRLPAARLPRGGAGAVRPLHAGSPVLPRTACPRQSPPPTWRTGTPPTAGPWAPAPRRSASREAPAWAPLPPPRGAAPPPLSRPSAPWWATTAPPTPPATPPRIEKRRERAGVQSPAAGGAVWPRLHLGLQAQLQPRQENLQPRQPHPGPAAWQR